MTTRGCVTPLISQSTTTRRLSRHRRGRLSRTFAQSSPVKASKASPPPPPPCRPRNNHVDPVNITLDHRLPFTDSVGGLFPGPTTTQKDYQGVEWVSQLAGLQ